MSDNPSMIDQVREELERQRLRILDVAPGHERRTHMLTADVSEPLLLHLTASRMADKSFNGLGMAVIEAQMAINTAIIAFAFAASDGDAEQTARLVRVFGLGLKAASGGLEEKLRSGKIQTVVVRDE